jgi:hypothetical protein
MPVMGGVARITPRAGCTELGDGWTDLPGLSSSSRIAIVAGPQGGDQVIVYAEFAEVPDVRTLEWSSRALRGLVSDTYPATAEGRGRLIEDAAGDGLPAGWLAEGLSPVARLELTHFSGEPRAQALELGAVPARVVGRLGAPAGSAPVVLCPAHPFDIVPIDVPR